MIVMILECAAFSKCLASTKAEVLVPMEARLREAKIWGVPQDTGELGGWAARRPVDS